MIILFTILMFAVFGKMIVFAFKAAWDVTKVFFFILLLPIILIAFAAAGLMIVSMPILVIIGIILLISKMSTRKC